MIKNPTRGKRARAAEAAAASVELAPEAVSVRRRRQQLMATIATAERTVRWYEVSDCPLSAGRLSARIEQYRAELASL